MGPLFSMYMNLNLYFLSVLRIHVGLAAASTTESSDSDIGKDSVYSVKLSLRTLI
jgi:hypothetical protein